MALSSKTRCETVDYSNDEDHNRLVVTVVANLNRFVMPFSEAIGVAVELDRSQSISGQHPRMGAVDVVPFIPIRVTMEEAAVPSKEVGEEVARRYNLPVFFLRKVRFCPHREKPGSRP